MPGMKVTVQIECESHEEMARVMAGISWAQGQISVVTTPAAATGVAQTGPGPADVHVGDPPGSVSSASTNAPPPAAPPKAAPAKAEKAKEEPAPPAYLYAKARNLRQVVGEVMKTSGQKNLDAVLEECRQQRELGHPVLEAIAAEDLADRVEDAFMAVVERG